MQKPQCPVKISTYLDWIPAWELFETRVGWVNYVDWKFRDFGQLVCVSYMLSTCCCTDSYIFVASKPLGTVTSRWKNVCYLRFGTLVAGGFQQLRRSWWKRNRCCFPKNARWWGCKTSNKNNLPNRISEIHTTFRLWKKRFRTGFVGFVDVCGKIFVEIYRSKWIP